MNKRETPKVRAVSRPAGVVRQGAPTGRSGDIGILKADLFAPDIEPAALANVPDGMEPDGLLFASYRDRPLQISIPLDVAAIVPSFDKMQLILDGVEYADPVIIEESDAETGSIALEIAATDRPEKPNQAPYRLSYQFIDGFTDEKTRYSGAIQFIVDLTPPGRPSLGAAQKFPADVVAGGLSSARLTELGDQLPAEIPSYEGVTIGDRLFLQVNDQASLVPIPTGNVGQPLPIAYPRTLIEQVDDGTLNFSYRISDRAGNMSELATAVPIKVLLKGGIEDLEAPSVPVFAANDIIVDADARAGVLVQIPLHENLEAGDAIQVIWGGIDLTPVPLLAGDLTDPLFGPEGGIRVSYATLLAALGGATRGTVGVAYRVRRDALEVGTSPPLEDVLVDLTLAGGVDPENPEHGLLVALTIMAQGETDPNQIPPAKSDLDATATIPWKNVDSDPVFLEGDLIQILWNSTLALTPPYAVTADDVTAAIDLELTVPGVIILAGGSAPDLPVTYTVTRALASPPDGHSNTARAPDQPVDVRSKADLPGGEAGLLAGSFSDAMGTPPNQYISTLVARGGTPFRVDAYLNKKVGDRIEVTIQVYEGTTGELVTPVGEPHTDGHWVAAGEEAQAKDFTVPESFFFTEYLE